MSAEVNWRAAATPGPLSGRLRVPGDKSISHRSVMLAGLAEGVTAIRGFLEAEDTLASAAAMAALGADVQRLGPGEYRVTGVGPRGLSAPAAPLDLGNSGTGMRLIAGLVAGQSFATTLVGDASLSKRPMARVLEPLRAMGARVEAEPGDRAPLRFLPGPPLQPIRYQLPVASAQVKSCLLLAGLGLAGDTWVLESTPTRDHSERMLSAFGAELLSAPGAVGIRGPARLQACPILVPADFSSAAFFLVAASLVPGSDLILSGVCMNPRRTGLLTVLRMMGARIEELDSRVEGGEPVADLRVQAAELQGVEVPLALVADMIDEFPALFVAAACARGRTVIRGAEELRVKESDRIEVMGQALRRLGAAIELRPDGALIEGGPLSGGAVDSAGDHRCAMALAVAASRAQGSVSIADCANVATSFPSFLRLAAEAGLAVEEAA